MAGTSPFSFPQSLSSLSSLSLGSLELVSPLPSHSTIQIQPCEAPNTLEKGVWVKKNKNWFPLSVVT